MSTRIHPIAGGSIVLCLAALVCIFSFPVTYADISIQLPSKENQGQLQGPTFPGGGFNAAYSGNQDAFVHRDTTGAFEEVIAFTSERVGEGDIYTMNADGSNVQRLTDDPAYDAWPTWSPDGSRIAFVSTRSGNADIYVIDADGGNIQQLTYHNANDIWPEWSPDGTRIAFASRRDDNFEIYVMDADGTNLQRLTNTTAVEDFPAWSPDGTRIVFSRIEGNDGTFIMNADGSGEWQLLDFPALEPDWSPDGTRIAFGSDHEGFRGIYVVDADGSNLQKLSTTYAGENCPDWSPDGTKILFASWRDGDGEIYVMDANGDNLQKLTSNSSQDEFPAWRPNFPFTRITEGPHVNDTNFSMGASWFDCDNDSYPDLFVAVLDGHNRLYRNNGDGSFSEVPGNIIIEDDSSNSGCWADFDNDGDVDGYIANGLHQNMVNYYYMNNGDGSFTKITEGSIATDAAASMAAVCADYNNDGALDIFTSSWAAAVPSNDQLYQGAGDGTFIKVTTGAIVSDEDQSGLAVWTDYDDDGDQDLIVNKAGDAASNVLFRNDGGEFTAVTGLDFLTVERGQDRCFGDFDNDGDQDLFIPTWAGLNSALFENTGGGTFVRVSDQPITNDGHWSTAACYGDFDNDGDLDIYLVNDNSYEDRPDYFYINDGSGIFSSHVDSSLIDNTGEYSCKVAPGDYDRDGDLDLYVVNWYPGTANVLYRNNGNGNNWLVVMPTGTVSNRSAVGAKVRVLVEIDGIPVWQMRELRSHMSSRGQGPLEAHFGLADASIVDSIKVEWPSGYTDTLQNVGVNQFLVVTEGQTIDLDGDGVPGIDDNCPFDYNPGQADGDGDSIGDACDPFNNCGDANGDEAIHVGDAVFLVTYIFKGGPAPDPLCSGDSNGDGTVNVSDAVHVINYIFKGGSAPVDDCCLQGR